MLSEDFGSAAAGSGSGSGGSWAAARMLCADFGSAAAGCGSGSGGSWAAVRMLCEDFGSAAAGSWSGSGGSLAAVEGACCDLGFAAADGADIVFAFLFAGTRHKVCVPTVMDGALEDMRGVGGVKKTVADAETGASGRRLVPRLRRRGLTDQ